MDVENFLHAIQPWRVISNREDKLILKGSNFGNYSMKLMYVVLNCPTSSSLPFLALSGGFFCLGGVMGKDVDVGSAQKKEKTLSKQMLPL